MRTLFCRHENDESRQPLRLETRDHVNSDVSSFSGVMTLEQERDQPKGATGGEAALPSLQAGLFLAPEHTRPALPHLSPRRMKPGGQHGRRPRTPVRQHQVDSDTSLLHSPALDSFTLLGPRSGHKTGKSPRSSPIQGHRSPLGKRTTHGPGAASGVRVVVPPLPPPPDPRSQASRVPPQPSSVESAESVNLMDLSSDTEQGASSVDLAVPPMDSQTMEVDFSSVPPPTRTAGTPLASPVWAANTLASAYHSATPTTVVSPSAATSTTLPSGSFSPRRTSPTVLSPVVVSMSIVGSMTPVDTLPLLEPSDTSCDTSMSTGDTVPLLGPAVDEEAASSPPANTFSNISSLRAIPLPNEPALTPEPTNLCAFVSPAASVTGLQIAENSSPSLPSTSTSPKASRVLPLLGFSPASLSSPEAGPADIMGKKPSATSPTQRGGITSPAPLSTPDLRVDMFDADYPGEGWRAGEREVGTPPVLPSSFPAITPEDLTPAELHEFDMKYGSPHHARSRSIKSLARPTLLALPLERPRLTSLPGNGGGGGGGGDDDEDDYYRLRHFSITGRRIINRGDSFKSRRTRSNTSVASDASSMGSNPSEGKYVTPVPTEAPHHPFCNAGNESTRTKIIVAPLGAGDKRHALQYPGSGKNAQPLQQERQVSVIRREKVAIVAALECPHLHQRAQWLLPPAPPRHSPDGRPLCSLLPLCLFIPPCGRLASFPQQAMRGATPLTTPWQVRGGLTHPITPWLT
ncbi:hypothetical protein O3P69_006773 [Scylla paramamosain]|uniref:Uncharacterized protein n=1 Tax=Scylla paramamosain TaxID=85552 RepID=A0AAW0U0V7_SCYPA